MSKKIWNLMYVVGNPAMFTRVTENADNPLGRKDALEGAKTVSKNGGWRTWVEHKDTGVRIFESDSEVQYQKEHPKAVQGSKANAASHPIG